MKRVWALTLGCAVMLTLFVANGHAQPKGPKVTVTGEVVDLWCYLEGGDRGAAKRECATACAKAGNPIGILDTKGNLYVTAGIIKNPPADNVAPDPALKATALRVLQ